MELKQVKTQLGKIVYYDTGQINIEGNSIKDYIFSACILRKKENGVKYYQAELIDTRNKKTVIIVPLERVLMEGEI